LHQIALVGVSERIGLKLFGREIIFEVFLTVKNIPQPYVMDRQTDRRTDRRHAIL